MKKEKNKEKKVKRKDMTPEEKLLRKKRKRQRLIIFSLVVEFCAIIGLCVFGIFSLANM